MAIVQPYNPDDPNSVTLSSFSAQSGGELSPAVPAAGGLALGVAALGAAMARRRSGGSAEEEA